MLLLRPDITTSAGLGVALLLGFAILIIWLSKDRHIALAGQRFTLLKRRVTLAQCGAALMDLTGSATVLYLFLPIGAASDFALFFSLFVVAVGAGALNHFPAGIGACEGTILLGTRGVDAMEVATALVMYRAVRTVLPFLLARLERAGVVLVHRDPSEQPA